LLAGSCYRDLQEKVRIRYVGFKMIKSEAVVYVNGEYVLWK